MINLFFSLLQGYQWEGGVITIEFLKNTFSLVVYFSKQRFWILKNQYLYNKNKKTMAHPLHFLDSCPWPIPPIYEY